MSIKIKSGEFIGQKDDKILPIRMRKTMYEQLRKLSFDNNISMAELCRQAIEIFVDKKTRN